MSGLLPPSRPPASGRVHGLTPEPEHREGLKAGAEQAWAAHISARCSSRGLSRESKRLVQGRCGLQGPSAGDSPGSVQQPVRVSLELRPLQRRTAWLLPAALGQPRPSPGRTSVMIVVLPVSQLKAKPTARNPSSQPSAVTEARSTSRRSPQRVITLKPSGSRKLSP